MSWAESIKWVEKLGDSSRKNEEWRRKAMKEENPPMK